MYLISIELSTAISKPIHISIPSLLAKSENQSHLLPSVAKVSESSFKPGASALDFPQLNTMLKSSNQAS